MRELSQKQLSKVSGGWSISTASIMNFFKGNKNSQDGEWSPVKPLPVDSQTAHAVGQWLGIATVAIASAVIFAVGVVFATRR